MNQRLYRSRTDTILGGVASGLATYINADPALVRIAWAILIPLTGGLAFLGYIVGWVVIPEQPEGSPIGAASDTGADPDDPGAVTAAGMPAASVPGASTEKRSSGNPGVIVGLALVAIGAWFLVREFLPAIDWSLVWPLVIVAVGVLIVVTAARSRA